jgi:hypothetical protein
MPSKPAKAADSCGFHGFAARSASGRVDSMLLFDLEDMLGLRVRLRKPRSPSAAMPGQGRTRGLPAGKTRKARGRARRL